MYNSSVSSTRTVGGKTREFLITIGLHQVLASNLYLFALVIDELTKYIQDQTPWCMLFANDVALVDESREDVNYKLKM